MQPWRKTRDLKFLIYKEERLYYLSSENKGADQLLHSCRPESLFLIHVQKYVFLDAAHIFSWMHKMQQAIVVILAVKVPVSSPYEPRYEETGLWGVRPGLTQTDLYSHRSRLGA